VRVDVVILVLLVAWPPVHMGLAHRRGFSPWRYGGLGMYSAPDGQDREVHVLLSLCEPSTASPWPIRPSGSRSLGFYHRVGAGALLPLPLPPLDQGEERALAAVVKELRSLARPGDFQRLAAWVDARFGRDRSIAGMAILVTLPRVDPAMSVAYSETFGFVRQGGEWSPLGRMRAGAAVQAFVENAVACP
jgi:hypothetical protein